MELRDHEPMWGYSLRRLSSRLGAKAWVYAIALAASSCTAPVAEEASARPSVASVAQALTDTDADGMDDDWEIQHFGDLSQSDTDDFDSDDMTNGEEFLYGFNPTIPDAFDDADGDRYPNIFEIRNGGDPNNATLLPTPTFVVDDAGGGTHLTVLDAVDAADVMNGTYQIIGIAPGVYTGAANVVGVALWSDKPKFLMIGLEGAANTIIDGGATEYGWNIYNSAVISSLTFQKTALAINVIASSCEVRLVDLLVRDNANPSYTAGVYVADVENIHIVGSTFFNNRGYTGDAEQIYIGAGAATLTNTVVWGATSGPMLATAPYGVTLTTNHSLVKGQTLSGTGNLAGTSDPRLRSDGRLRSDSPLRSAGGSVAQSRLDFDGELRPTGAPDIGVDQFNDADADGLPDGWEIATYGNTTSVDGTLDPDNDSLTNAGEYDWETDMLDPDTDGDGIMDGIEVAYGLNPRVPDADDLTTDLNGDGLLDSISIQLGYVLDQTDTDGDSVSNADEILMGTNLFREDSDGDGVPDNLDPFPLDPLISAFPVDPEDVTPPIITLTAPWYAVAQ